MSVIEGSHGEVGKREAEFSRLLDARRIPYDDAALTALAGTMISTPDQASNEPDAEENLAVPAGYTYFGQFVDHDLTFETTSAFKQPNDPTNLRTPRLDLDCVYGSGPADQPYLYATETKDGLVKGVSLVTGQEIQDSPGRVDLLRIGNGPGSRAVIGDPRNDENSIVCNVQLAFIAFHNAVVKHLLQELAPTDSTLFARSRQLVRWTYQRIVIDDYLPRIIEPATYEAFVHRLGQRGEGAFQLYTPPKRGAIPIEFAGAAYRFGHSMVRTGYKLNPAHTPQRIFEPDDGANSLVGFGPLLKHWIEWKRFFPTGNKFPAKGPRPAQNTDDSADRLQWAYRIDTSLVDPLKALPTVIAGGASLADLNLRRGNLFKLVSGQIVADTLGVKRLDSRYLAVRDGDEDGITFKPIPEQFLDDTPLWFYILAEAQREVVDTWITKGGGTGGEVKLDDDDLKLGLADPDGKRHRAPIAQLGPVGGNLLLETFFGLLLADSESILRLTSPTDITRHDAWFATFTKQGSVAPSMWQLLEFSGLT